MILNYSNCWSTHTILCSLFHMDMEITKRRMDFSHMLFRRLLPKMSKFQSNPSFVACIQTLTHPSPCSLIRIMWRNRNENQNIDEVHRKHWITRNVIMPSTYLFQCDILTECWLCCSIYIRNFLNDFFFFSNLKRTNYVFIRTILCENSRELTDQFNQFTNFLS